MSALRDIRAWLRDLPIADPLQRRHAVTLQLLASTLCVAAVLLEAVRFAAGRQTPAVTAVNLFSALIAVVALVCLRKGLYQRGATILVAGFGLVQSTAFVLGGLQFSRDGLKNIGLLLTLAALVAGRRALWTMLAVFAAAMSIAYLRDLHYLWGPGPRASPVWEGGVFWASLLSFLILAIVLDRFGLTMQEEMRDRRRVEAALRNSEELFRVAFQTNPSAINITRIEDGIYVAVNEGFTLLSGWPQEEAVGRTSEEMGLWVDRAARARAFEALGRDGWVADFEARFRRRDGSEFLGVIRAQKFDLARTPHLITITRDVTAERAAEVERGQLQAQLLQAQKLDSIGRVAGGVAHDLNNLLTAVLCYTDLLEAGLQSEAQRADLEQIRLGGQRAANLTRQLLSFARKQPIELGDVDLNALIERLGGLLRRLIGEQIDFQVRLCPGEARVRADPGQLEQVVVNLVVNARDAMPEGGRLTVEVNQLPAAQIAAENVGGLAAVDHLLVSVSDTGSGMSPEVVQHLFEPFFTTKEVGKGTGLGLATCYGIVRQAGGQIAVDTGVGKGTTVRVYLPRLTGERTGALQAVEAQVNRGEETVLVVEDEAQLRALTTRILRDHGYRVLEAADGLQGLEVAEAFTGAIDLLLTDVVMPRLGGAALADKLRAVRPDLRVLFVSGYADSPQGLLDLGTALLQKPFTAPVLLQRVRRVLDA